MINFWWKPPINRSEVPLLTFQRHALYWTQVNLESNLWVSISDATDGSETAVLLADENVNSEIAIAHLGSWVHSVSGVTVL